MGTGAWTENDYKTYMKSRGINDVEHLDASRVDEFYTARCMADALNPYGVKYRECCDNEEHPNTLPVILALDVTGSMGSAVAAVARKLNDIIQSLYDKVQDVEFMVMGIGDFSYDTFPLQVSQFESDVRILDQLGKIYFERGGGGNGWESYTAAWYFASRHTKLDCWHRNKKGIIITMGDEPLNPYLPREEIREVIGDNVERDVETKLLYKEVGEKYDIYHIIITDSEASSRYYMPRIKKSFGEYLDGQHLLAANSDNLPQTITDIVMNHLEENEPVVINQAVPMHAGMITW